MSNRRVQFYMAEEIADRLDKLLPWGAKQGVFHHISTRLTEFMEEIGAARAIGILLTGHFKIVSTDGSE